MNSQVASNLLNDKETVDILGDEVLVEIFSYLDGDELLALETVCKRWHRVIDGLVNWKKIYKRQINSCPIWCEVSKSSLFDENQVARYRALYREVHRKIQEMDRNWQRGEFLEKNFNIGRHDYLEANDDFLIKRKRNSFVVYDRRKMEILHETPLEMIFDFFSIKEDLVIFRHVGNGLLIFDASKGNKIAAVMKPDPILDFVKDVAYKNNLLAVLWGSYGDAFKNLQLWRRMAQGLELVHQRNIVGEGYFNLDMDERYLVVRQMIPSEQYTCDRKFFVDILSTEDLSSALSLGSKTAQFHCARDILFVFHVDGVVRLMDVPTGKWFRTIPSNGLKIEYRPRFMVNSKYLVIVYEWVEKSTVTIYDLAAAKNPSVCSNNLLLATFEVKGIRPKYFRINEREIIGIFYHFGTTIYKSWDFLKLNEPNTRPRRSVRQPSRYGNVVSN